MKIGGIWDRIRLPCKYRLSDSWHAYMLPHEVMLQICQLCSSSTYDIRRIRTVSFRHVSDLSFLSKQVDIRFGVFYVLYMVCNCRNWTASGPPQIRYYVIFLEKARLPHVLSTTMFSSFTKSVLCQRYRNRFIKLFEMPVCKAHIQVLFLCWPANLLDLKLIDIYFNF